MSILKRAMNICLTPGTEWDVIEGEQTPTGQLVTGYIIPLAAIGAVTSFIGSTLLGAVLPFVGGGSIVFGLVGLVLGLVMAAVGVFVISLVVNLFAPTFGGQQDSNQALKVTAYSFTPGWLAGVLNIIPILGGLLSSLIALYGFYLLYLGLPKLMKSPQDKAVVYTLVVAICGIVVSMVLGFIVAAVVGIGAIGAGAISAAG